MYQKMCVVFLSPPNYLAKKNHALRVDTDSFHPEEDNGHIWTLIITLCYLENLMHQRNGDTTSCFENMIEELNSRKIYSCKEERDTKISRVFS